MTRMHDAGGYTAMQMSKHIRCRMAKSKVANSDSRSQLMESSYEKLKLEEEPR